MTKSISNMGDFVKYIEESDEVITPYIRGFVNVEGGNVGLATEEFSDCETCEGSLDVVFSCKECRRTPQNYVSMKSGYGDGIYSYFDLFWDEQPRGGIFIFDENFNFTRELREVILQESSGESSSTRAAGVFWRFLESRDWSKIDCSFVTTLKFDPIKSSGIPELLIADSGNNIDSNNAVVRLPGYNQGKYCVFAFFGRQAENENVPIPLFLLIIEEHLAIKCGFEKQSKIDWSEESRNWSSAPAVSAVERQNISTIVLNIALEESRLSDNSLAESTKDLIKMRIMSWLAQLYALEAYSELNQDALNYFKSAPSETLKHYYALRGLHSFAAEV